jgi:hypothetical protein
MESSQYQHSAFSIQPQNYLKATSAHKKTKDATVAASLDKKALDLMSPVH